MIHIIQTIDDPFVSQRNWNFIREQLRESVELHTVTDENDHVFATLTDTDTVIVQTRNINVIDRIAKSPAKHTGESVFTIVYTEDKEAVKKLLSITDILYPKTIDEASFKDNCTCFVKPISGYNSEGVDETSVCHSRKEVNAKCASLRKLAYDRKELELLPMVEEFIDGVECTVAIFKVGNHLEYYPIKVNIGNNTGIMTSKDKWAENEWCEPYYNDKLIEAACKVFYLVEAKHYMRIDFRVTNDDKPYVIDLNLYPCLGPIDHLAKCTSICKRMSYYDTLVKIIETANR